MGTALPGSGGEICGKQVGNQRVPGVGRRNLAEFEYIEGTTLEGNSGRISGKRGLGQFYALFDEYVERISYGEELPVADYDLIFANILVSLPEGAKAADLETVKVSPWTVIDYEWTFGKSMSAKETAYRALYC